MMPEPAKLTFGNGEGKGLTVCVQMAPAREWKIASKPMKTTTTESSGAVCKGRNMMRSMSTPMMNENSMVAGSAIQNG